MLESPGVVSLLLFRCHPTWPLSIISFFIIAFGGRVSLCGPGCLGTLYVDQAGLGLTEICLRAWD